MTGAPGWERYREELARCPDDLAEDIRAFFRPLRAARRS